MKRALAVVFVAGLASVPATAHAAFPGANGKIAFTTNRDSPATANQTEVYSMAPDGGGQTRVTFNPSVFDFSPRWSPDGRKIAFYVPPVPGTDSGVFVMDADGGDRAKLTKDGGFPGWSPDGKQIVFAAALSDSQGPSDIYVMDADGGDVRRLTGTIGIDTEPSWSPDGRRIAFYGTGLGLAGDIFVVNADGTGLVNMTETMASESHPDWSPDGSEIAFFSDRSCGSGEIYTMDAAGGDPVQVTDGCESFDLKPAWSPDGSRIVFSSNSGGNFDIYTIRPDGTARTNVTNHPADEGDPDWQPLPNRRPDCSAVRATPQSLGAPNHRLITVTLSGATDPDGDAVDLAITGVTQDEPVTGPPDAVATSVPHRVRLRAERDPKGDGRVYRIAFEASDARGGTCTGFATAEVRKGGGAPVDSAPPSHDSFGS